MAAGPPVPDPPGVISPCTRRCCLDAQDVCLGCGRHLQEILRWHAADDAERRTILVAAEARRERRTGPDRPAGGDWQSAPE